MNPDFKNVLIIAPHPDDEILGCGGTMHLLASKGYNIYVLIVTKGDPEIFPEERIKKVREEALDAHRILNVKETRFLEFIAPNLDLESRAQISRSIEKIIKEFDIQILFLPHRGDIHHDHRIVFESALVAARPVKDCPVKCIYSYETLSETEWAAPFASETFIPNVFFCIENNLDVKLNAFQCYKTQVKIFPGSRSVEAIKALAVFRGVTIGKKAAESFMLIREIND
jgi:N-acetylglucosamine malate deacetylase 1